MIKAVLDTNIVVRGHISPHGTPAAVLDAFYDGQYVWVTSPRLRAEQTTSSPKTNDICCH